jgi:hypothetical protein
MYLKKWLTYILAAVSITLLIADMGIAAEPGTKKPLARPVVMEEATVRGRIVVLETRKEDRKVIENLPVNIWQENEDAEDGKELIHATRTDEDGFFNLPLISTGEYLMSVGELQIKLFVIERAEHRKDQEDPKILLILLPTEVIKDVE